MVHAIQYRSKVVEWVDNILNTRRCGTAMWKYHKSNRNPIFNFLCESESKIQRSCFYKLSNEPLCK